MSTTSPVKRGAQPVKSNQRQQLIVLGAVIAVAVIAIVGVIALSGSAPSSINSAEIPQTTLSDGAVVLGDPNAPITIVEFADFACPHCQTYHSTMTRIVEDFVMTGQAKFEYRIFPTAGGAQTVFSGQLLHCAEQQAPGSFWRGYDLMWTYISRGIYFGNEMGSTFARDLGLNYSELLACTSSSNRVTVDQRLGQTLGVTGTPGLGVRYGDGAVEWLVVNGVTFNQGGPGYDALATAIREANES